MMHLVPSESVLVVVDIQERLAGAMPPATLERLVQNTRILLDAAQTLGVAVIATEQYPKGLGATLPAVREKLDEAGARVHEKSAFDALGDDRVRVALAELRARRKSAVVVGMEAHVCVYQTTRSLAAAGWAVHVVADAVSSRSEDNRRAGLDLAARAGAIPTVTETVVFDWLGRAGTDEFKKLSKLVK